LGASESEEIQRLRLKIKTAGVQPNPEQLAVLKDAEENDTHIQTIHRLQSEIQQAMEDEIGSRLGQFASQLVPFVADTHKQLIDSIVGIIGSKYKSIERDSVSKLKADLETGARENLPRDSIAKILSKRAASQISATVTKGFVRTVEHAADMVFDVLLARLEDMVHSDRSAGDGEGTEEVEEISGDEVSDHIEPESGDGDDEGGNDNPPVGAPPPTPAKGKKMPPQPPAKGSKPPLTSKPLPPPKPGARGKVPPKLNPVGGSKSTASPRSGGSGSDSDERLLAKQSNIRTHMTKDRPLGPAERRRPQRKPNRRPMMKSEAS